MLWWVERLKSADEVLQHIFGIIDEFKETAAAVGAGESYNI